MQQRSHDRCIPVYNKLISQVHFHYNTLKSYRDRTIMVKSHVKATWVDTPNKHWSGNSKDNLRPCQKPWPYWHSDWETSYILGCTRKQLMMQLCNKHAWLNKWKFPHSGLLKDQELITSICMTYILGNCMHLILWCLLVTNISINRVMNISQLNHFQILLSNLPEPKLRYISRVLWA